MTEINVKEGELVWCNEHKGYGFVKIDDTEVFLHRSTLDRFGLARLLKGNRVTMSLMVPEHGELIQDLLRVDRPVNPVPPAASEPADGKMRAVVQFFNDIRSCGFVTAEDIAEDIFVYSRVLNDCGFHSLIQGQKLLINEDDAGKGTKVQAVRLPNE